MITTIKLMMAKEQYKPELIIGEFDSASYTAAGFVMLSLKVFRVYQKALIK